MTTRPAVEVLERGGEHSLLAEALTTLGRTLARGGQFEQAGEVLLRAAEVAEAAGDLEGAQGLRGRRLARRAVAGTDAAESQLDAPPAPPAPAPSAHAETVARLLARKPKQG